MPNLVLISAAVWRVFIKQKCDGRKDGRTDGGHFIVPLFSMRGTIKTGTNPFAGFAEDESMSPHAKLSCLANRKQWQILWGIYRLYSGL